MGIGTIAGWLAGWFVLSILVAWSWYVLRSAQKIAIIEREEPVVQHWLKMNVDPISQERIYDEVALADAPLIKGEQYLLAECSDEQFQKVRDACYPLQLGYFRKRDWTAGHSFYLFCCVHCRKWGVSSKQGLGPSLWCGHCETSISFASFARYRDTDVFMETRS